MQKETSRDFCRPPRLHAKSKAQDIHVLVFIVFLIDRTTPESSTSLVDLVPPRLVNGKRTNSLAIKKVVVRGTGIGHATMQ